MHDRIARSAGAVRPVLARTNHSLPAPTRRETRRDFGPKSRPWGLSGPEPVMDTPHGRDLSIGRTRSRSRRNVGPKREDAAEVSRRPILEGGLKTKGAAFATSPAIAGAHRQSNGRVRHQSRDRPWAANRVDWSARSARVSAAPATVRIGLRALASGPNEPPSPSTISRCAGSSTLRLYCSWRQSFLLAHSCAGGLAPFVGSIRAVSW